MLDKYKKRQAMLEELINLANTSDEDLEKMDYREKQKVYKSKNILCRRIWDSSKGTYRKKSL